MRDKLDNYHLTCLICWDREELIVPEYVGNRKIGTHWDARDQVFGEAWVSSLRVRL